MRGLLIKDLKLLKNMKNSLVLIVLIAIGMAAYISDESFIITYLVFIGMSFVASTISYDEFDNGYAFLFSLPVTRKGYIVEKYLFGLCVCGGGWLIGTVISTAAGAVRGSMASSDSILTAFAMLPVTLIFLSVLLPFHLKFGGEKGRIVLVGAMGLIIIVCILGAKFAEALQIDPDALEKGLAALSTGGVAAGAAVIGLVILFLSCRISMGIMAKKEF